MLRTSRVTRGVDVGTARQSGALIAGGATTGVFARKGGYWPASTPPRKYGAQSRFHHKPAEQIDERNATGTAVMLSPA
jgi:hypothetical protein